VESVEQWLRSHGATVSGRSSAGDWVHVTVPVSRAEKMLGTKVSLYYLTSICTKQCTSLFFSITSTVTHLVLILFAPNHMRYHVRSTPMSTSFSQPHSLVVLMNGAHRSLHLRLRSVHRQSLSFLSLRKRTSNRFLKKQRGKS
jgi:tripeptidyl-peptidase-1